MSQTFELITIENQKLKIHPEALSLFKDNSDPLAIVTICGEYRTGKSFLLNSLFGDNGMFDVSPTTQPCTQGINILKSPLRKQNMNIWVIDTQGFGSLNKDSIYDSKIFLLMMLLSDVLIYNSKGSLDEQTIAKFSLTCQEAASIAKDISIVSDSMKCKLFWVLRDFSLSLIDQKGKQITANEYLEQALSMNGDHSNALLQRRVIKAFFNDRECIPLVRPCFSENSLNSLHSIKSQPEIKSEGQIREEFRDSIVDLKKKILNKLDFKRAKNKESELIALDGNSFIALLERYVSAINQANFLGGLTVSWDEIKVFQSLKKADETNEKIQSIIRRYETDFPLDEYKDENFKKEIESCMEQDLVELQDIEIKEQLEEEIENRIHKFSKRNKQCLIIEIESFLRQSTRQLEHKLMSLSTMRNYHEKIKGQFQKIKQNYHIKFESFLISQSLQVEMKLLVEELISQFWESMSCNLVRKWREQTQKYEESFQELKHKNHSLNQQIKEINISVQQNNTKQISRLKAKNEEMMRNMKNYNQVIDRMESINENLKNQLQITLKSEEQTQNNYEKQREEMESKVLELQAKISQISEQNNILRFELRESQDVNSVLDATITSLREKLRMAERENDEQVEKIQQQISQKSQNMLQVLQNQRSKYQQLMAEWKSEENHLKEEINEREMLLQNARAEKQELRREVNGQIEDMMVEHKIQSQKLLNMKKYEKEELIKEKCQLEGQTQRLSEEMRNKDALIQQLEQQIIIIKRQNSIFQSKCQGFGQEQSEQMKHLNEKIICLSQEIKLKDKKLEMGAKQLSQLNQRHQKEIKNLTDKLQENNANHEKNSKQKESFLKRQLEIEVASKLNEAGERVQKLKSKNHVLEGDIETYRSEISKLRKQIKQAELRSRNCQNCFENEVINKNQGEEIKGLKSKITQLQFTCEAKEGQLLSLRAALQEQMNEKDLRETTGSPECPEEQKTPKKRVLDLEYLENFSRSPQAENRKLNQLLSDEKEKMMRHYTKKQLKHQQIVETYKSKIESLLKNNQKLRECLEHKSQEPVETRREKRIKIDVIENNLQANFTDYDSLTSELKNKISELSVENKKLRSCLEEERTKFSKMESDSFKMVNMHKLMKKSRIEQVEQIMKENADLRNQLEKIGQKAGMDESVEILTEENRIMKEELLYLEKKVKQMEKMEEEQKERNEELQELTNIQKGEISNLITHYEQRVIHLRASQDQCCGRLERKLSLIERELEHERAISKELQQNLERMNKKNNEEKVQKIEQKQKNYKDRLNKIFA